MFTFAISWVVGITCMMVEDHVVVFEAAGLTAAMVFGLTLYAIRTKEDFTICGGLLYVLAVIFSFAMLMALIFGPQMKLAIACLGVLLYSFYLVHDTQMIIGGKHKKFKFDKDSYVLAAMAIYLDIINLFLFILQILDGGKKE